MQMTTLLFDLDGTLLPFDIDPFMKGYFHSLVAKIAHLVDTTKIVDQIWQSTRAMMENEDASLSNVDVFREHFLTSTGIEERAIWPVFDNFYEHEFNTLQTLTKPTPISQEICRTAVDKGYKIVLATNPIFPEAATKHRMHWAGIDDIPFELVTTMEHMHFCKPNPKYFLEITDMLGVSPTDCMMFGNDVQEDGVAAHIGMQTFLVNDYKIDRNLGHVQFTHEGSLQNALSFIQQLPAL